MKTILLIISGLFALSAHAQTDSIEVLAYVADAFTGAIIEDGEVEMLAADSSLIGKGRWGYNVDDGVRTATVVSGKVPGDGEYLLRLTHKDYFTEYFHISIKTSARNKVLLFSETKSRCGSSRRKGCWEKPWSKPQK